MGLVVHRLIPLMVIEIVAHLTNCFRGRCLIFYRYPCEAGRNVELNMIAFKDVLILLIYFHHFISFYALIVVALHRATADLI